MRGNVSIEKVEAERDAALAAIERVRKYADERSVYAKTRNNIVGSWRIASDLYDLLGGSHEEQAALDGAPEPEWEYGRKYVDEAGDPHIRTTQDVTTPDGHRADGSPYWNYRAMRRRKAGPWLPVEGESNGDS